MPDIPDIALSESTEGRILQAVVDRLKVTSRPGIPPERIVIQSLGWVPDEATLPPPYIIVTPSPEATPPLDGTNETDDTQFAVFITVVLANARELLRYVGTQLLWRQNIRRKMRSLSIARFGQLSLESGTFFTHGWIESGDKFIEAAKRDQRDAQYFLVRFKVKEPRE
jgi:hypothetical protein